jgi:hypothetical protein
VDDDVVRRFVESCDEAQHVDVVGQNRSSKGGDEDWPTSVLAQIAERMRPNENSVQEVSNCPRLVQNRRDLETISTHPASQKNLTGHIGPEARQKDAKGSFRAGQVASWSSVQKRKRGNKVDGF